MRHVVRYKKDTDVDKVHKEIENKLGIVIEAKNDSDTVNGYVNTHIEGDERVVEIFLYENDQPADFEVYERNGKTYSRGNKINIVVKKPKNSGWEKLTGRVGDII